MRIRIFYVFSFWSLLILFVFYCNKTIADAPIEAPQAISNADIIVEPVSLEIAKIDMQSQFTRTGYIPLEKVGTNLNLRIYSSKTKIYAIDESLSKLISFIDDRGENLITAGQKVEDEQKTAHPQANYFSSEKQNGIASIACMNEKNECFVKLNSDALPSKGSNALNVKGELVVLSMNEKLEEINLQKFALRDKAKLTVGVYTAQLINVGIITVKGNRFQIYEFETPIKIDSITASTKDGKIVEAISGGTINQFQFPEEALNETITNLKITYHTPQFISIPVDLSVGLDLKNRNVKTAESN